ncbi:hypothetical protein GQ44DRAFT_759042 [Phaeosphaeriaceae sp. PMI808]|nr:hypothetical protein GQ44DRAFT_759042 [Phaeosphaeriaceae sp. PMI808]
MEASGVQKEKESQGQLQTGLDTWQYAKFLAETLKVAEELKESWADMDLGMQEAAVADVNARLKKHRIEDLHRDVIKSRLQGAMKSIKRRRKNQEKANASASAADGKRADDARPFDPIKDI